MSDNIFTGCMPALMTPCTAERKPDFDALVAKGRELIEIGMSAVVYCGSMGDWPLLTEAERQEGVARLVAAGIPTIVGTGAVNSREAVSHAAHAAKVGAKGLMVIPRLLSRGSSPAAQKAHFAAILNAAPNLPAVIYNSPYYGFATRADPVQTFKLRADHHSLEVGLQPATVHVAFIQHTQVLGLQCAQQQPAQGRQSKTEHQYTAYRKLQQDAAHGLLR